MWQGRFLSFALRILPWLCEETHRRGCDLRDGFRALACIDNHWYMLAHGVARKAVRTFALSRVSEPRLTGERFTKPESFNPNKYLRDSLGVMKGEEDHEVVIEFDSYGTDLGAEPEVAREPGVYGDAGGRITAADATPFFRIPLVSPLVLANRP